MEIIFKNTYSNIKFVAEFGVISYPLMMQDEGGLIDDNVGLINVVGNGVSLTQTDPHKVQLRVDHPLEPVQSVFGRTGNILAEYADYEADQIYKFDEKVEDNIEVAQNTSLRHQRIHEWDGNDHSNMPTSFPPAPHDHTHASTTGQTPDDHHAQVHTHDGSDGSGTVNHDDTIGVTSDNHHAQVHAHDGTDGSGTVAHDDNTGITPDNHHDQIHTHDGLDGSGTVLHVNTGSRNAANSHNIAAISNLQTELDSKALINDVFDKTEFIDISAGSGDSGKPIVLNSQGAIDPSMIDASTFYYVGPHNPSGGTEYPDTTGESHGAFWVAQDIATPPYTFTGGDLIGLDIDNGDFMVWGTGGWSIMRGEMNPLLYYKLDGSQSLTGNFAGGGYVITDIAPGVNISDGARIEQVVRKDIEEQQSMIGPLLVGNAVNNKNYIIINSVVGGDDPRIYFRDMNGEYGFNLLINNVADDVRFNIYDLTGTIISTLIFNRNDGVCRFNNNFKIGDGAKHCESIVQTGTDGLGIFRIQKANGTPVGSFYYNDATGNIIIARKNDDNSGDEVGSVAISSDGRFFVKTNQTILGNLRVGDGTEYNSVAVQAGGGGNAAYFMLREDGQNAGVIFYDAAYKVLRFIKYSEDDPTQIIGQAYLDEHGDLVTSNDLFSGDNITAASSINVGVNANGNSAVRFHDDAGGVPTIFWNNVIKEFQVDVNADEGYTLYHSGNFSAGRVFEELSTQYWNVGSDTVHTLPVYDIAIESVFVDGLLLNPSRAYTVNDTGTEIQVILNTAPTVETCINYRVRN